MTRVRMDGTLADGVKMIGVTEDPYLFEEKSMGCFDEIVRTEKAGDNSSESDSGLG